MAQKNTTAIVFFKMLDFIFDFYKDNINLAIILHRIGSGCMNIRLQDVNVIITGTSRYNNNAFDTVRVETLLVTDEPISPEETWYVPNGNAVPPAVLEFFKVSKVEMNPMKASTLLLGTEDIRDQAEAENLPGVMEDAARLMLRAILTKSSLVPVAGSTNAYLLSYDYKIYPLNNTHEYTFSIRVPFDGLQVAPNGGKVQVNVLTPDGAQIDTAITKGIDENGTEITESVASIANTGRHLVSFSYQIDPEFIVHYRY